MAFCDFCTCPDCQHGRDHLDHAPTVDGRWICDVCWRYDVCDERKGEVYHGPCEHADGSPIVDCKHRPKLAGEFRPQEGAGRDSAGR